MYSTQRPLRVTTQTKWSVAGEVAAQVDVMVRDWLVRHRVPESGNGWCGKLRMAVTLLQQGGPSERTLDLPFLKLDRCILPLTDVRRN